VLRFRSSFVASLAVGAVLPAQSLALSAPLPTLASVSSPAQSVTLPAGPLVASGALVVGTPFAGPEASFRWESSAHPTGLYFGAQVLLRNPSAAAASLAAGPGEILLALSAPTTMQVDVALRGEFEGAVAPQLSVDVFDDAVLELSPPASGDVASASLTLTIGPAPVPIRTRLAMSQSGSGESLGNLRVVVTPRSQCTVARWSVGCGGSTFVPLPTFDGNVEFAGAPMLNAPVVGVLGFGIQPLLLGQTVVPCVLFPSPDALLVFLTWGSTPLTIPAALRPFEFWAQGVAFDVAQLTVSDAFRVTAF
jgi:hypothetical protein